VIGEQRLYIPFTSKQLQFFHQYVSCLLTLLHRHPACFTGQNLASLIIGSFSIVALLLLACFSAFVKSSVEPIDNDTTVRFIV
jgi:hypothetical protein